MKIVSSYGIEIKGMNKIFRPTLGVYNDALTFCVSVFEKEWSSIEPLDSTQRKGFCDKLIHGTSKRPATYPNFDTKFYKMPSYIRRNIINSALGYLSSYHSNLKNWKKSNKTTSKPTLQKHLNQFPTFYRDNTYLEDNIDKDVVKLKLFINNDWKFVKVKLKHTDLQYIRKHFNGKQLSAPTLEKKYNKWFLRFAIIENVKLNTTSIQEQKVLAIDLGINTDATCSVMKSDGTILARKFINFVSEKDRIYHCLNKIKKAQKQNKSTRILWRYCKSLNDELARKVAKEISDYALKMKVDTIVFEYLDIKGKKKGSKKQKLSMWKKNTIQNIVKHKAHRNGMRFSHVCAYNTSKLAFDGSGEVLRGSKANLNTYELCKFKTGKIYNCDLSASYNIAARYFIREILKTYNRSDIEAKVPLCQRRILCTYNTLLEINKVI